MRKLVINTLVHSLICIILSLFLSWVSVARSMRLYNWLLYAILNYILLLKPGHHLVMLFIFFWNQALLLETKYASVNLWIPIFPLYRNLWVYWITACFKSLSLQKVLWPFLKQVIDFNIYSPNASSTSINVPCNSTLCQHKNQCSATDDTCPYQISYLSNGTSSTGFLVEDMLHLVTDDDESKGSDAQITFG